MQRPSDRLWWTLLLLAAAISIGAATRLPGIHVSADLVGMLPESDPASRDYRLLLEKFGALDDVYIVVSVDPPVEDRRELLVDGACALAETLEASSWFKSARCGATEEDERFLLEQVLPRAILLLDPARADLVVRRTRPEAIRDRVAQMRSRLAGPFGLAEAPLFAADPLGLAEGLTLFPPDGSGLAIDPVEGVFQSRSGSRALVVATPTFPELDTEAGAELAAYLDSTFAALRRDGSGVLSFDALGGPLYAVHDAAVIRRDAIRMSTGSVITVALLLLLYFGGFRTPAILVVSVFIGVVWTAASIATLLGQIGVLGISFAAILVGLGVDYGIHGASTFQDVAQAGLPPGRAMRKTFSRVGPAILTSATTTAAAFLILLLADLRPVRELGLLISCGIVLVLATSVAVGASLLVILSRTAGEHRPSGLRRSIRFAVRAVVDASTRRRVAVLAVAGVATLVAIGGAALVEVDASPRLMRPVDHPLARVEQILLDDFRLGLDGFTVVVRGRSTAAALEEASQVAETLRALDPALAVLTPSDFLVEGAFLEERVAALAPLVGPHAVDTLRRELKAQGFDLEPFSTPLAVLDAVAEGRSPAGNPSESLPAWLRHALRVSPEGAYAAIQVSNPSGRWPDGPPEPLVAELNRDHPDAAVASIARVGSGLRRLIVRDLRLLSGWCVLIVGGVVLLSFRLRARPSLLALLPVTLGCLWLLGFCGFAGIPVNLFSVTAAPMLLGLGIDDGLHVLHGARAHGGMVASLRVVGPPMVITTLSTCAGFGSLTLSRIPALREGGLVIALGAALCLLTTMLLLPALDRTRSGSEA